MKTSKKIISLILAVVMIFSTMSAAAFAAVIPSSVKTVDALISNENLATLVQDLLKNINGAKENITGTILRLVFTFVDNEDLNKYIDGKDVTKLSDEAAAKILLDWLDGMLPELTSGITQESWWSTVQSIVKLIGISDLNLSSVDGILGTVYDVCKAPLLNVAGDAGKLNGDALKNVKRSGGDLKVIYALIQWLNDNSGLIAKFVRGGISSNGLDLGSVGGLLEDSLSDINAIVANLKPFLKSYLYLLIDGKAEAGEIKGSAAEALGDLGKTEYKNYTADELLAAALIRLIEGKEVTEVIAKSECDAALNLSFYKLIAKYGKTLYSKFAVDVLNDGLRDLLAKLKDYEDTKDIFNYDYNFTDATFDAAFDDIEEKGVVAQLNNIVVTIFKTILNANVYAELNLKTGDNSKLNDNFAKACRYILPILANHSDDLGFDFSDFTADKVKDLDVPAMAVGVLKIFFPGWFSKNYDAALVNSAKTVAQLGVAALYFVSTNTEWITLDNWSIDEFSSNITAAKIGKLSDDECVEILCGIGAKMGVMALEAAASQTHFANNTASTTWEARVNDIVDWAIGFVKGLPAVMVSANVYNSTEGAFYKVNVALNEIINFNFLSNVGDESFALDTETLIFDAILGNVFKFDLGAVFGILAKNSNAGNILNEGTVISSTIGFVDQVLTSLFSHTCGDTASFTREKNCTTDEVIKYCKKNGHYVGTPTTKTVDHHNYEVTKTVNATCAAAGSKTLTCSKCGDVKKETIAKLTKESAHKYQYDKNASTATCIKAGTLTQKCSVCGKLNSKPTNALDHDYNSKGVCTRCGVKKHTHSYTTKTVKATMSKDGSSASVCKTCSFPKPGSKTTTIKKISSVTLGTTGYTYSGSAKKPTVTVKDSAGKKLTKDTDYTVSYSNNTAIGKASAKVTFKGKYSGNKTLYFTISPKKVAGLKASSQTTTSLKLSWTKDSAAAGYKVYKVVSGKYTLLGKTTSTSYTVKSLKAGTTYTYAVKAYKGDYASKSYATVKTCSAPAKVTGFKASSQTTTSIKLSWTKVTNATGYEIYTYSSSTKKYTKVTSVTGTTYTKKSLKAGSSYTYYIRAYKTVDGKKVYSTGYTKLMTGTKTAAPKAPTLSTTSKKITAKWTKVTGATGYELYMKKGSGSYSKIYTGPKLTYVKSSLVKGTSYTFRVRTYKTVDGKKIYSDYSSTKTIKCK